VAYFVTHTGRHARRDGGRATYSLKLAIPNPTLEILQRPRAKPTPSFKLYGQRQFELPFIARAPTRFAGRDEFQQR